MPVSFALREDGTAERAARTWKFPAVQPGDASTRLGLYAWAVLDGVLIAACVAVVSITMLKNHFILAGALAFVFAFVAWMAGRDVIVNKSERMDSFYRALARADSQGPDHRFTGGPVGRWASTLRKEDYAVLADRVADAAKRGGEAADELLREIYDRRVPRNDDSVSSPLTLTPKN